jgi:nucleoside triphosphate pyrophosphatase
MLYLASKSPSRRMLLEEAKIPFMVIDQTAEETSCDWGMPLEQLVLHIARMKMDHAIMPVARENEIGFVLTADTLTQDNRGAIHGKPLDYADSVAKIKALRPGARICTAFCLEKKIWRDKKWQTVERIEKIVAGTCIFEIDDTWIDYYLTKEPLALQCAGAMVIERFGGLFLKQSEGSYTAIMGLPLFELRQALYVLGFFDGLL